MHLKEGEWKGLTVIMGDNVQITWRSSEEGLFQ
jgi:hypothetical protein